jgi:hypothetical protein
LHWQKMKSTLLITILLCTSALAGEWVNISDIVTSQVKPGYAGPTAGIVVDRGSGDVFLVVNDQGCGAAVIMGQPLPGATVRPSAVAARPAGRCKPTRRAGVSPVS